MVCAPLPPNETERLLSLRDYDMLDTPADPLFDGIAALAAQICETPIALVSLIDQDRQWFKSNIGLPDIKETQRAVAFCAHAIHGDVLMEVPDAQLDIRFHDNPLVTEHPHVRFYAGMPLHDPQGLCLGTLCVVDQHPKKLSDSQRTALEHLAKLAMSLFEQRKVKQQALERERKQALIADLERLAFTALSADALLEHAVVITKEALGFACCKVLALTDDAQHLVLRAADGWPAEHKDQLIATADADTQSAQALAQGAPVVVQDFAAEQYTQSSQAQALGLASGITLLIPGPNGPFGVLAAHATQAYAVTPTATAFIQSVANVLGMALTRRQNDEKLAYLAQFDSLTGLPNRHLFRDRMSQAIARASRSDSPIAVLVINLDGFKLINSNHGHSAGDRLLVHVAQRLQSSVRADDSISRRGGDEFGVILSELGRAEDTATVVQKLLAVLAQPFDLDGTEVFITACAGVAMYSADGKDADTLIKHAEIAMQRAKEQGHNSHQFYAPEMNQRVEKRMRLESSLRHALSRGEFLLHYQPKLSVTRERYCGAEALLRWHHPERGLVGPNDFIPILEETGLIVPVGLWVLTTACAQMRAWQNMGIDVPSVAVNLSARQFQQADLVECIRDIIHAAGVSPEKIELEITESMLMHDPQQAARTLHSLKALGVRLSVDDFGTGYSSLAYLKQFPLDALKIDRAFINNIAHDPNDAAITLTIINLAHNLKLKVVAEGVESETQARFLMDHGCDALQGFYFSRPVDAETFTLMQQDSQQLLLPEPAAACQNVLLLDDSDDEMFLLERALMGEGYRILKANTPQRAFEHLAQQNVSMVIADQGMPNMSGIEFLSRVRHLYPEVIRIVRTGNEHPGVMADAINQASIHKFMSKQLPQDAMRQTLREAFQQTKPDMRWSA